MDQKKLPEPGGDSTRECEKKQLIVVLGMHRSGTSAITRGLQVMGVELGDRLIPAAEGINDKGYWEDIDLNKLNIELFRFLGSDWHRLAPIEADEVEILRVHGYLARALGVLSQKFEGKTIFGCKNPRIAKLLPFWENVFNCCPYTVQFVLVIRHPFCVIKSLTKLTCFEAEQGYLLWLGHVIESLSRGIDVPRILVDYDRLMQSPEFEINRMAKKLGLDVDRYELEAYKSGFLDKALQHNFYDLHDLSLDNTCPPLVSEIYATLRDVALDKRALDEPAMRKQITDWNNEYKRLTPFLKLADRLCARSVAENTAVAERDEKIASLEQIVAEQKNRIRSINQVIFTLEQQITRILASTSWKITQPLRKAKQTLLTYIRHKIGSSRY